MTYGRCGETVSEHELSTMSDQPRSFIHFSVMVSAKGFTLIELLVTILASIIILLLAGNGLIAVIRINQINEAETRQQAQLNRALDFMADEVREARAITVGPPAGWTSPGGCDGIFSLVKPNPAEPNVAYYVCSPPGGTLWQGSKVLYRATTSPTTLASAEPLIDALSTQPMTNCTGSPSPNNLGIKAVPDGKKIEICLKGVQSSLSQSPTLELKIVAFARGS